MRSGTELSQFLRVFLSTLIDRYLVQGLNISKYRNR